MMAVGRYDGIADKKQVCWYQAGISGATVFRFSFPVMPAGTSTGRLLYYRDCTRTELIRVGVAEPQRKSLLGGRRITVNS